MRGVQPNDARAPCPGHGQIELMLPPADGTSTKEEVLAIRELIEQNPNLKRTPLSHRICAMLWLDSTPLLQCPAAPA
jgi:hypothetical protein